MSEVRTMNDKEVLETIVKCASVISKDETRWHLCGVHIKAHEGKLVIEATDAHRMIRREVIPDDQVWLDINEALIRKESIAIIKLCLKEMKYVPHGKPIIGGGGIKLLSNYFIPIDTNIGTYPDLKRLVPAKPSHAIGLNAQYLIEIARAMKDGKAANVKIFFDPENATKPLIIETYNGEQAVLMPVRV